MNFLKKVLLKEYIFSALLAVPVSLVAILSYFFLSPIMLLIVSSAVFCFGINFIVKNVSRVGVSLLFFFTYALLTINVSELGVIGLKKLFAFMIAGVIFELIILLTRKIIKFKAFLGTVVSLTFLPFIAALLISPRLAITFPNELINLILVLFIVSLTSSSVYMIIWHFVRVKKPFIKLKSYLGSLNH
jgi:hypothetical protein